MQIILVEERHITKQEAMKIAKMGEATFMELCELTGLTGAKKGNGEHRDYLIYSYAELVAAMKKWRKIKIGQHEDIEEEPELIPLIEKLIHYLQKSPSGRSRKGR